MNDYEFPHCVGILAYSKYHILQDRLIDWCNNYVGEHGWLHYITQFAQHGVEFQFYFTHEEDALLFILTHGGQIIPVDISCKLLHST